MANYIAERSTFEDRPMIRLKYGENDPRPFSFGYGKARKIINCIEEIKKFVEDNTYDRSKQQH